MTTMLDADRAAALRTWMDERDVTIRYVAEQLGVSMTLARRYLMLWKPSRRIGTASLSCWNPSGTLAPC